MHPPPFPTILILLSLFSLTITHPHSISPRAPQDGVDPFLEDTNGGKGDLTDPGTGEPAGGWENVHDQLQGGNRGVNKEVKPGELKGSQQSVSKSYERGSLRGMGDFEGIGEC